jgi:hypothetical protein
MQPGYQSPILPHRYSPDDDVLNQPEPPSRFVIMENEAPPPQRQRFRGPRRNKFFCEPCEKQLNSIQQLEEHEMSRRHIERVQELELEEPVYEEDLLDRRPVRGGREIIDEMIVDPRELREARDYHDSRPAGFSRDVRESRPMRDPRDERDLRELRETREVRDPHPREHRGAPRELGGPRDFRGPREDLREREVREPPRTSREPPWDNRDVYERRAQRPPQQHYPESKPGFKGSNSGFWQ